MTKVVADTVFLPRQANSRYKTFNYALLHTKGLRGFLDFMRYERAFFARFSDVLTLVEASKSPEKAILGRFSILVGRYDDKGITSPGWTEARLMSHQELEPLSDHQKLFELDSNCLDFAPHAPLKFLGQCHLVDVSIAVLFKIMCDNKAMIAMDKESQSHHIEDFLLGHKTGTFEANLENFQIDERRWVLP